MRADSERRLTAEAAAKLARQAGEAALAKLGRGESADLSGALYAALRAWGRRCRAAGLERGIPGRGLQAAAYAGRHSCPMAAMRSIALPRWSLSCPERAADEVSQHAAQQYHA